MTTPYESIVRISYPLNTLGDLSTVLGKVASGSGFIVGDHTIITAAHVVEYPNGQIVVQTPDLSGLSILVPALSSETIPQTAFQVDAVLGVGPGQLVPLQVAEDYAVINFTQPIFAGLTPFVIYPSFNGGTVDITGFATAPDDVFLPSLISDLQTFPTTVTPDASYPNGVWDETPPIGPPGSGTSGGPVYIPGTDEVVGLSSNQKSAHRLSLSIGTNDIPSIASLEDAPIITGTKADQAAIDQGNLFPFSGVQLTDLSPGTESETATVTPSVAGTGNLSDSVSGTVGLGTYTVSGTASQVAAALDALMFPPADDQATAGQTTTTDFTISVVDSSGYSSTDSTTSVVATEPADSTGDGTATVDAPVVDPVSGQTITYTATVDVSPTDILLPAIRLPLPSDSLATQPFPVVVTYDGGNLDPNELQDDVLVGQSNQNTSHFLAASIPGDSLDPLGPGSTTGTIGIYSEEANNGASGDYSDQLPLEISYDGSSSTLDLTVNQDIYTAATAEISIPGMSDPILDFGAIHVGQTVTVDVDVTNTASGALTDTLVSEGGLESQFIAAGGADIAAGNTGTVDVALVADVAGLAEADESLLGLTTHDPELPDQAAASNEMDLSGEIYNYATPDLFNGSLGAETDGVAAMVPLTGPGAGVLTQDGNDWNLDFGTVQQSSQTTYGASVELLNLAPPSSYSDGLTASDDVTGSGFVAYTPPLTGLTALAGPATGLLVGTFQPDQTQLGSHTETVVIHPFSVDTGGTVELDDITLTVTDDVVSCFAAGTLIEAARGDIAVEDLTVDDVVRARFAGPVPIRWIGRRRVDCRRHPDPRKVWPVRVRAGAFGGNVPRRDLYLSPDHAVFADGVLTPAKYLVNGTSVAQVKKAQVTYFHIELARHDVLLAEGLPTESFLPDGDRGMFDNGGRPVRLHTDFHSLAWEALGCAPMVVTGATLGTVRRRLRDRVEET